MDFQEEADSPEDRKQAHFVEADFEDEFRIYAGGTPGEDGTEWMADLAAVDFQKPAETKDVITFDEVPPIYNSSHSSGSHGRPPVTQTQSMPQDESFEVITYESPANREEEKQRGVIVNVERMKVEGVELAGELATTATERFDGVLDHFAKPRSAPPEKDTGEPSWPELTIQLAHAEEPQSADVLPRHSASNPAFQRFQKPPAEAKVSLQAEFEEDAMGEAREWQVYSANPDLNDDQQDERGDEFSLDMQAEVAIRTGGEKQYTSDQRHAEVTTLDSLQEVKRPTHRRNKKINLHTRMMIAEARSAEEVKNLPKTEPEPALSPDLPASTPLKASYNHDFPKVETNVIIAEFQTSEEEERKNEEEWNSASVFAFKEMEQVREPIETRLITYSEAWTQFEQMDISDYVEQEAPLRPIRAWWPLRCFGIVPEDIEVGELKEKCRRILVLVKVNFDNSALHLQMLMTVWKLLTGRKRDCPRFGSHWDEIGFQGSDPATDLRGMGIFGLLQLLYFCCNFNEEAKMILAQAQQPHCSFPFATVSINISKIVVEALRDNHLNTYINKWRNVFDSVQFFYVGTYLFWFQTYMKRNFTVADVATLNIEVAKEAKRHPDHIFQIVKQIYHQKGVIV